MQNVNIASNTELFAPRFVIKRDGKRVPFDAEKIVNAIKKSGLEQVNLEKQRHDI